MNVSVFFQLHSNFNNRAMGLKSIHWSLGLNTDYFKYILKIYQKFLVEFYLLSLKGVGQDSFPQFNERNCTFLMKNVFPLNADSFIHNVIQFAPLMVRRGRRYRVTIQSTCFRMFRKALCTTRVKSVSKNELIYTYLLWSCQDYF